MIKCWLLIYNKFSSTTGDPDPCNNITSMTHKCGQRTETALLRVYSDIVTTIGKGNGSFLALLDLSAAFDTIDHSNLFDILEKYVRITRDALQFIISYFSDRSQSTRIESIMYGIVHIICGVPQGSVLGL